MTIISFVQFLSCCTVRILIQITLQQSVSLRFVVRWKWREIACAFVGKWRLMRQSYKAKCPEIFPCYISVTSVDIKVHNNSKIITKEGKARLMTLWRWHFANCMIYNVKNCSVKYSLTCLTWQAFMKYELLYMLIKNVSHC